MTKLNCCGQALQGLLIVINIFILLLGLFAIGAGSFDLVVKFDLDYVTGSDQFSGAAVVIAAGVAMVLVAGLGIIAGCGEVWGLVAFYMFCLCGLIGMGMGAAFYSATYEDDVSERAQEQFRYGIVDYRQETSNDYDPGVNLYVDIIQAAYQCCGSTGPADWITNNLEYCIENLGLPDSCSCYYTGLDDDCLSVTIPIPSLNDITFSSWTKGCEDSIDQMVSTQAMISIIVSAGMVICQVLVMCCSFSLCILLLQHSSRARRTTVRYAPLDSSQDAIVMDHGTMKEEDKAPNYPPPAYYPTNHPDGGSYTSFQPV